MNKKPNFYLSIDAIRIINNLRNALAHNYPKDHKFFRYTKWYIYDDLKIKDFYEYALGLFKKLNICVSKIHAKNN